MLVAILAGGAAVYAQQAPMVIGRIEGNDLSINAGSGGPSIGQNSGAVSNGNTVTLNSGDARLMLTAGGEIDICGPAKFTLLQSSDAITLALDFGRARVQLPASTNLRIFTPTTVATPIDINGAPRDVTLGLELDDSLCVHPASGALLLENQFSNEKLVVPQGGEFSLAQGKLVPVAGAAGSCQCVAMQARVPTSPPLPSLGLTAPAHLETPTPAPATAKNDSAQAAEPDVEFSVPAHANEAHPVNISPKPEESAAPPPTEGMPNYKIVMPPLTFSANSPAPPPGPSADMVLLIRTVEVEPEWKFSGHVDPPALDDAPRSKAKGQPAEQGAQTGAAKKKGFWARVRRFFSGSES
ncbi:MAG TPA: hypothetical protein VMH00_14795 [Candidatus Limnocylindrales bacterium]|nr:hypothetical protein [Candidatus Limnocylindrales bacterium]